MHEAISIQIQFKIQFLSSVRDEYELEHKEAATLIVEYASV